MLLCLDVGNSHIYGGIFQNQSLISQFRYPSNPCTSDEIGIFLKTYLREMGLRPDNIQQVAICSVVPSLDYSIRSAFVKYFSIDPFVLHAKTKANLQIHYQNPHEVGPDRLANAIAAKHLYPDQNMIIVDLGTATTFEVISDKGEFLGGAILPGLLVQMKALNERTANLPPVKIVKPTKIVGQSTMENIQSGLYYGHFGAISHILDKITKQYFSQKPIIIGTGGFASLYEQEGLFNVIHSDLVLQGLRFAYEANTK